MCKNLYIFNFEIQANMTLKPPKYVVIIVAALVLPTLSVVSYNLYIDPFQIFHKDFEKPNTVLPRKGIDRIQHAGLINQYPIETIILGHSHLANYIPSKIEKEFNTKNVFNFSMDASPIYEHAIIAAYVIGKHALKYVIWGFNSQNLLAPYNSTHKKIEMPIYLYDNNRLNDLKLFLSFDLYGYHKRKNRRKQRILSSKNIELEQINEFDRNTAWYWNNKNGFNRPVFVANKILGEKVTSYAPIITQLQPIKPIDPRIFIKPITSENPKYKNYFDNLNNNIKPIILQNPKISFYFIFSPPYPLFSLQVKKLYSQARYIKSLQVMKKFVEDMEPYKNTRVFGFGLEIFTEDLRIYKDATHYHIAVNNYLAEKMARDEGRLTKDNVADYIINLDKKVVNYRLPKQWNPVDASKKPMKEKGFLTMTAAIKIIEGGMNISDEEIIEKNKIGKRDEIPKWARNIYQNNGTDKTPQKVSTKP